MEGFKASAVYQIYTKSFQDSNGDGLGDIRGVISRLDYIKELGADYIWLTPFFKSPLNDNGYDVSDYLSVDPVFGTMEDVEELIAQAEARGLAACSTWYSIIHPRSTHGFGRPLPEIRSIWTIIYFGTGSRMCRLPLGVQVRRERMGIRSPSEEVVSAFVRRNAGGFKLG